MSEPSDRQRRAAETYAMTYERAQRQGPQDEVVTWKGHLRRAHEVLTEGQIYIMAMLATGWTIERAAAHLRRSVEDVTETCLEASTALAVYYEARVDV